MSADDESTWREAIADLGALVAEVEPGVMLNVRAELLGRLLAELERGEARRLAAHNEPPTSRAR
ncbi:MAG: hypothetical protein JST54_24390 [Deltaproteobacteria bacterium]|nr:hypothetical protein [Deltaproteobacteria bacterium]